MKNLKIGFLGGLSWFQSTMGKILKFHIFACFDPKN